MQTTKIAEKEFAEWVELAQQDAEGFERQREAAIEAYITSLSSEQQARLRRLQWRIDQERRLARTPMAACIKLSRLMWNRVLGSGGLREQIERLSAPAVRSAEPVSSGEVVNFARENA